MLLTLLLMIGMGVGVGFLGGLMARNLCARSTSSSLEQRPKLSSGARHRSLSIGGLAAGGLALTAVLAGPGLVDRQFAFLGLAASFVLAGLYVMLWLKLVATFGQGPVEAGELSLLLSLLLLGVLYLCGILLITLVVLGACVVLGGTMLSGVYIYRFR
jgi:hypothetical protein